MSVRRSVIVAKAILGYHIYPEYSKHLFVYTQSVHACIQPNVGDRGEGEEGKIARTTRLIPVCPNKQHNFQRRRDKEKTLQL